MAAPDTPRLGISGRVLAAADACRRQPKEPGSVGPWIRATPIAESMLALVLIDHALRHRAQCGDVRTDTPRIPALAPEGSQRLPSPR